MPQFLWDMYWRMYYLFVPRLTEAEIEAKFEEVEGRLSQKTTPQVNTGDCDCAVYVGGKLVSCKTRRRAVCQGLEDSNSGQNGLHAYCLPVGECNHMPHP